MIALFNCVNCVIDFFISLEKGDWIQLISSVSTFLAVIISILVFSSQRNRDRRTKSIAVGNRIEELTVRWAYIDMVLKGSHPDEYSHLVEDVDTSKMIKFEASEIEIAYSKSLQAKAKKLYKENDYNTRNSGGPALLCIIDRNAVKQANDLFPKLVSELFVGDMDNQFEHGFHRILVDTLNKMETLCMMIRKKLIDEYVIFEAVNDKFVYFVTVFYYYISKTNDEEYYKNDFQNSKKLRNIIWVYNKWTISRRKSQKKWDKRRKRRETIQNAKNFIFGDTIKEEDQGLAGESRHDPTNESESTAHHSEEMQASENRSATVSG